MHANSKNKDAPLAWEFVYLTFTGSEVQRIVAKILELNQSPILQLDYTQLQELWNILQALLIEGEADVFFYSAKVYHFLLGVLARIVDMAGSSKYPSEIQRMQEYI